LAEKGETLNADASGGDNAPVGIGYSNEATLQEIARKLSALRESFEQVAAGLNVPRGAEPAGGDTAAENANVLSDASDVSGSEAAFAGVARGGVLNVVGAVFSSAVNLALILVIARGLSRPDAGAVFGATSLLVLIGTAARLGTEATIVHVLGSARALQRPEEVRPYLRAALLPVIAVAAVAGVAVAVAGVRLLHLVARGAAIAHGGALIVLIGVAVPVAAAYPVALAATRGLGRVRPTVVVERVVRPTLQLGLVVGAIAAGGGAFAVTCAWIAPYAVAAVAVTRALRRLVLATSGSSPSHGTIDFGAFWRFTLPRALAGTIQVALQRLDILLVGALRGAAAAAVYTAATRFVVLGQIGNQAIWYAVQPRLAMLVASRDLDAARRLYRVATAWVIVLTWPLALAVLPAAAVILNGVGSGYASGRSTMILMSIAVLFSSACGPVEILLITVGRTSWNLWNTALAFVVNTGIDVLLIPRIGIIGAALGWAASILVRNALALAQVGRGFGFRPFSRAVALVELGAVVCFAALPAAALLAFGHRVSVLAAALSLGTAIYAVQLWQMREPLHLDRLAINRRAGRLANADES
jgi:O-antigen/teichoic acid export membrane protein